MKKPIAEYLIHYYQCLDEQGNPSQPLPQIGQNSKLLLQLYRTLVLLRTFDSKAVALQRTGKIGTYAGILGQEVISTAIGATMQAVDVFCPAYREYGAMIQRGMKLSDILAFWGGDERGSAFGHPDDFPICVPIGTQCLHAVGVASAFKIRKEPRVAVVVIGDGGTSQGDFYEALNVAGDWKLPVLFVVNNNQWAISVPRSAQTGAQTLAQKAIAAGFEGMQVDGNDIIAMYDACEQAIKKARQGEGPTLIEAMTYRLCDHTTADDAKRYRAEEEVAEAWQKEPFIRFKNYLLNAGYLTESMHQDIQAECSSEVEKAVADYINLGLPEPESIFDYHYQTLPHDLKEQRKEFLETLSWPK